MPLTSRNWSRKRKIDHGSEWLFLRPRVPQATRAAAEGEAACSSTERGVQGGEVGGASALPVGCTGVLPTQPDAGSTEGGGRGIGRARGSVVSERSFGVIGRDVGALEEVGGDGRALGGVVSDGRAFGEAGSHGRAFGEIVSGGRAFGEVRSDGRACGEVGSTGRGFGDIGSHGRAFEEVGRDGRAFEEVRRDGRALAEVGGEKFGACGGATSLSHHQDLSSSTLLPDPSYFPHHKLVKLL